MKIKVRAYDWEAEEFIYSDQDYDDAFFEFKDGTLKAFRIRERDYGPPEERAYADELEDPQVWTGLNNKNGKAIYEGDILQHSYFHIYSENMDITVVFWADNRAGFCVPSRIEADNKRKNYCLFTDEIAKASEVIGNICENPELVSAQAPQEP